METIIMNPSKGKTQGVIECSEKDSQLIVRYNLTSENSKKIMRLKALSSKKPYNIPLKIDVPLFENGRAEGERKISETDLGICGYKARDIDTFVITYETENKTEVASFGFGGLWWDISYSIGRILKSEENNPIRNTENLLSKLKLNKENKSRKNKIITALYEAEKIMEYAEESPDCRYRWYRFQKDVHPFGLSIFQHITENMPCHTEGGTLNGLLAGIGKDGHIALAIKQNGKNPFEIAEDCAVLKRGYWVVGVCFLDDGQYFERI